MVVKVTAASFIRSYGQWIERARVEPVCITRHGHDVAMVQSPHAPANGNSFVDGAIPVDYIGIVGSNLLQGFLAFDDELRVIICNATARAILQVKQSETIGASLEHLFPQYADSLLLTKLERALRSGMTETFDVPSIGFDGRILQFRVFALGIGAACVFHDITEDIVNRRRTDIKAATVDALACHGEIGCASLSIRGTFDEVDATFAAMGQFEPSTLLQARLSDILPLKSRREIMDVFEKTVTERKARVTDTAILMRDGNERPTRLSIAPVLGSTDVRGAVVIAS